MSIFIIIILLLFCGTFLLLFYRKNILLTNESYEQNDVGFIILRHVNNTKTNEYWLHSYDCVRIFYPNNKILIIDDNSNYKYITNNKILSNTNIINSEFKARGELLPYYYFLILKPFKKAVIIHDSVFFNKYIDFKNITNYQFLWEFKHNWDSHELEAEILNIYGDQQLIQFHNDKSKWSGCFGAMNVITYDCIQDLNRKYKLEYLIPLIDSRQKRFAFERIISCILIKEYGKKDSLLGDIHSYCNWGVSYDNIDTLKHLPVIKIWTGR